MNHNLPQRKPDVHEQASRELEVIGKNSFLHLAEGMIKEIPTSGGEPLRVIRRYSDDNLQTTLDGFFMYVISMSDGAPIRGENGVQTTRDSVWRSATASGEIQKRVPFESTPGESPGIKDMLRSFAKALRDSGEASIDWESSANPIKQLTRAAGLRVAVLELLKTNEFNIHETVLGAIENAVESFETDHQTLAQQSLGADKFRPFPK